MGGLMSTYNGWRSYETWAVNLWLTNDCGSQQYWQEQAAEALGRAGGDKEKASWELAVTLKEELSQHPCDGLHGDLLNAALSEVDWVEVAEHFVEAAWEEEHE